MSTPRYATTPWDAGFQFRGDADVTIRIVVGSNGEVYAIPPDEPALIVGTATAFDLAPGAVNQLQLFVRGGVALVGVNGEFVAAIELLGPPVVSDVQVGAAFFDEDFVQDRATAYEGFSVWQMRIDTAQRGTASRATSEPPRVRACVRRSPARAMRTRPAVSRRRPSWSGSSSRPSSPCCSSAPSSSLTGYPQIGGHGLHIAHMLFGGAGMLIALLASLTFLGPRTRSFAAIVGGAGFGAFIDELGKFITSDNDYFYQPAVALIYVVFVLLFIAGERLATDANPPPNERLAQALDVVTGAVVDGYPKRERDTRCELLAAERPHESAGAGAAPGAGAESPPRPIRSRRPRRRTATRRGGVTPWLVSQRWFLTTRAGHRRIW